jgi:hypothetical protein
MVETANMDKVYRELLALRKEVSYIREHMVDADSVLTQEENLELDKSIKELKEGKAFSLKDIEKDREDVGD